MAVSMGSLPQQQDFSSAAVQLLLQQGAVPYERFVAVAKQFSLATLDIFAVICYKDLSPFVTA